MNVLTELIGETSPCVAELFLSHAAMKDGRSCKRLCLCVYVFFVCLPESIYVVNYCTDFNAFLRK